MNLNNTFNLFWRNPGGFILWSLLFIFASYALNAQEPPPRPVTVTVDLSSNLCFGSFWQGSSGGTVIVYPDGTRSVTGDVVELTMGPPVSTSLFDVTAYPGTVVSVLDSDAILTGDTGGWMTLQIRTINYNPLLVTTMPPSSTQMRIGGTLIVGFPAQNPPGIYGGSIVITFVQE